VIVSLRSKPERQLKFFVPRQFTRRAFDFCDRTHGRILIRKIRSDKPAINPFIPIARRRYTQPRGILSSPALADGKVFLTVDGNLLALPETDPNGDGVISADEMVWSYAIGGDGVYSPVIANGFVYIGNHQGTVYCFGSKN